MCTSALLHEYFWRAGLVLVQLAELLIGRRCENNQTVAYAGGLESICMQSISARAHCANVNCLWLHQAQIRKVRSRLP